VASVVPRTVVTCVISQTFCLLQGQHQADNIIVRLACIIHLLCDADCRLLSSTLKRCKYIKAHRTTMCEQYKNISTYYFVCVFSHISPCMFHFKIFHSTSALHSILWCQLWCTIVVCVCFMLCSAVACTFWATMQPQQRLCIPYLAYCPVNCKQRATKLHATLYFVACYNVARSRVDKP